MTVFAWILAGSVLAQLPLTSDTPRPTPVPSATPRVNPIVIPRVAPGAVPVATAAPVDPVESRRAALLGEDRAASIEAVEAISVEGGGAALAAIADFLERWEGDREMTRRGLNALRRVRVEPTEVADLLGAERASHRIWAAWTAGEQRIGSAGDALLKLLEDAEPRVRSQAAISLGVLADPRANEPLLRMAVHDPDPTTRQRAADAMVMLAAPADERPSIAPVLGKLRSKDEFQRLEAARELVKLRDPRSVPGLLEALRRERDLEVSKKMITALSEIGDEIAVPALVEVARRGIGDVRPWAIGALATLEDPRAVPPLIELTRDHDLNVRRFSVRALVMLDKTAGQDAIMAALADPVVEVRSEAVKALAELAATGRKGEVLAAVLARVPAEPDEYLRQFLVAQAGTLAQVGDPGTEKLLLKMLEDRFPNVQRAAAAALGRVGSRAAERPLLELAKRERKKKKGRRDGDLIRIAEDAARQVKAR